MPSDAHEQLVRVILDNPTSADASLADLRADFDAFLGAQPLPDDFEVTTVNADGVSCDWVTVAGARTERVVLLLHGGGYAMGSAAGYREFASRLSRAAAARVAVIDYRLAPEAPYPAALDDAVTAYRWLLAEGVTAKQVVVVGDSGGVGFALSVVARIRDEQLDLPAGLVGFCPWVDLSTESIAHADDVGDPISTREGLGFFAAQYLQEHSPVDPRVNLLHGNLAGMPPLLLLAGTRDVGYRDALRVAELARAAGIPVTVKTYHGLIHNFQLAAHLPEAEQALAAMGEFVDEHLRA
jgi:epsilon-lactone hydrolase